METKKIAFFGECMIELSGSPLQKTFGGDTLNTALYLARLLQDRPFDISYATGLGLDSLSQEMANRWESEGITCDLVAHIEGKNPGLYMVETDHAGERSFHYWRNDSAAKRYFDTTSPLELAIEQGQIDALYLSGISLAILDDEAKERLILCIKQLKQQNKSVFFDNNYRPQLWSTEQARHWYGQVLRYSDVALITEDDDLLVWGESSITQRCKDFGCRQLVIKRGCEPCLVIENLQNSTDPIEVAAQQVDKVIDTCAAGDSFAAGYLAGYLSGQAPAQSAALGHALAGTVIQYSGAIIPKSKTEQFKISGA